MTTTNEILNVIGEKDAYANRICSLVKQVVSTYYELPLSAYDSKSRVRQVIKMKQASVYFIRNLLPKATLIYIGKQMRYDHATVLHCLKTINNLLETDKETIADIQALSKTLQVERDAVRLDGDLSKEYYYINMENCFSIKLPDGRAMVLSEFSNEQVGAFIEFTNKFYETQVKARKHKKTGLFILEKNDENGENAEN